MQIIKSLSILLVFICPFIINAQTTYLPEGSKEYQFIDRLEIKQGQNTDINYSTLKPYSRRAIVQEAEYLDSARLGYSNSLTGRMHNKNGPALTLQRLMNIIFTAYLMDNSEWVTGSKESFLSKKPVLKSFYVTKPNLLEVNVKDFFLAVNPVLSYQMSKESSNDENIFYNKRGVTARGVIANRIGFSTTLTDNQERGPLFFQSRVNSFHAVPGVGFYKTFKTTGYDYFDARGY